MQNRISRTRSEWTIRKEWIVLVVILIVGASLRVAYLEEIRERPEFERPVIDAAYHDYWARALASGDWTPPDNKPDPNVRTTAFFRPPGYPYFLAAVYTLFGDGYVAPRAVQGLLGLANVLLAFLFARRCFGAIPSLVAALGMSCYWALLFFESELQATALLIFLWLVFLNLMACWLRRRSWAFALGAGIAGGAAALVRPNFLAVVVFGAAWMVWAGRDETPRRTRLTAALVMLAGTVLTISPVTVRNYRVSGELVPVSANAGINLYIGNNPSADGLVSVEIPGLGPFRTSFDWPGLVQGLERTSGRTLNTVEADDMFRDEALKYIAEHPGRFASLSVKKALLFWGPREVAHNREVHFERRHSPLLSWLPGSFAWLLAFAVLGFGWQLLEGGVSRLGALACSGPLAYFLSVLPFFAAARYRLPVVPVLLMFGAWALVRLGETLAARRWRYAIAVVLVLAGLVFIAGRPFADYEPSLARWYYDRGVAHERTGDPDRAIELYRESVQADVTFFNARYNLAHLLKQRGDLDQAIEQWTAAARTRDDFAPTHYNLGVAYMERGDLQRSLFHFRRAHDLARANGDLAMARAIERRLRPYRKEP